METMKTEKENPSDYPNVTYWAFPKVEEETQDFEEYRPEDNTVWFPEGKGGWKPAKDIAIVIKVTYLSEPVEAGFGIDWQGYLWRAEIHSFGNKDIVTDFWPELRMIEGLQAEAFAVAAGFCGAILGYRTAGWFATGS